MKRICCLMLVLTLFLGSCSSVKVLDAWRGDPESVAKFQDKNVLVMARTADNTARIAFEEAIKLQLERQGIQALESFKKFPKLNPEPEISEERIEMVRSILDSEGFTGIVITVVKDKSETVRTNYSGVYVGAGYSNYYPGYYGGFYNYYAHPYAYGPYYAGVGGYIPKKNFAFASRSVSPTVPTSTGCGKY